MPPVLYYTVSSKEVRSYMPAVPVLLSAASFVRRRKTGYSLQTPHLPPTISRKGADCGGFPATVKWGGIYRFSDSQYVDWLSRWCPQWAATKDLCCLDSLDPKTLVYPGETEVRRRQQFTTEMANQFWERYWDAPFTWVPTIQGYYPAQYERHARELAPLIRTMHAYYRELDQYATEDGEEGKFLRWGAFRVGIGSLCRRLRPATILEILRRVSLAIGRDIRLHLWGTKLGLLKSSADLLDDWSLDTNAYNGLFGEEHEARRASGYSEAEYTWLVSQPRYAEKVAAAGRLPKQSSLQLETELEGSLPPPDPGWLKGPPGEVEEVWE